MSNIPKSDYLCPVCKVPLSKLPSTVGRVLLWCRNLQCYSQAACDGESGATDAEAYEKILRAVDKEATRNQT